VIKKGPHSEIPERNSLPDAPDTRFTNAGNKMTLDVERVLEREADMWEKIRTGGKTSGYFGSRYLWSNIVTVPFVVVNALDDVLSFVVGLGLYGTPGNNVIHLGVNNEKTYAINKDMIATSAYLGYQMPQRIKDAITAWVETT